MARSAPFRRTLDDELRDPKFATAYHAELQRLRIAHQIATARQKAGLTQAELARRMGTAQPTVARLERGDYMGYTVATLAKAARALKTRLRVELEPPARRLAREKVAVGALHAFRPERRVGRKLAKRK